MAPYRKILGCYHFREQVQKAQTTAARLTPLIGSKSELNNNKRRLYKMIIRPQMLNASPVWGSAAPSNIKMIQSKQSRILRNIANAPWYVKTANIHSDLGIEYITDAIKKTAETTLLNIETHPCKRIREAVNYDEHEKRRYKRPRHVLLIDQ
ncbi:hypothetical protein CBL_20208 [Carabus blaptoides fortunei]